MSVVDAPRGGAAEGGPRPLDTPSYADIMSDMKTFTVRELDRSPGVVLEASRIEGKARIRARGGQTYIIMPEPAPPRRITSLPNFAARRAALLAKPLSPEFTRKFDRALAGERHLTPTRTFFRASTWRCQTATRQIGCWRQLAWVLVLRCPSRGCTRWNWRTLSRFRSGWVSKEAIRG